MLPDGARIDQGLGNLDRLALTAPDGEAHVYLHGAHVTHFQARTGAPVLFVSRRSHFEAGTPGKPIRGGVPICFPWFGAKADDPRAPAHGFARTLTWQLGDVKRDDRGTMQAALHLSANDFTRALFPHEFAATLIVTVSAHLTLELVVKNTGSSPMTIEQALHSYFAVGDVRRVSVTGLEGVPYVDKTQAFARMPGASAPITIAGETDRVYGGARGDVTIVDPVLGRRVVVRKVESATTVVWNPWTEKAKTMSDFGDEEWQAMICVEAANTAEDAVILPPGTSHTMSATLNVLPL